MMLTAPDGAIELVRAGLFGREAHNSRMPGLYLSRIDFKVRDGETVHDGVDVSDTELYLFAAGDLKLEPPRGEVSFLGRSGKYLGGKSLRSVALVNHTSYYWNNGTADQQEYR